MEENEAESSQETLSFYHNVFRSDNKGGKLKTKWK